MGKIKILNRELSDMIAAGEVVENPSSLVKELIENSLDAQSSSIDINLSNDCRNITIKDNGIGMSNDDLDICLERHATSKISEKEDLFNISTYGFRGEALSSIASVSRLSIASKTDEDRAMKIYAEAGEIVGKEFITGNRGTSIIVEDLFFNIPARLKFLSSSNNEFSKIKDIVIKEALANPETSFNLSVDNNIKLSVSGKGIENTILEIFGLSTLKSLNRFNSGFIGNSDLFRASRNNIFTYFNRRYAKSTVVDKAILDSYNTILEKGKYPFIILFLDISPKDIDVNVHPSKKVVKFVNERSIYQMTKDLVSSAVDSLNRHITSVDISTKDEAKKGSLNSINYSKNTINSEASKNIVDFNTIKDGQNIKDINLKDIDVKSDDKDYLIKRVLKDNEISKENKILDIKRDDYFTHNRFVGQIFNTFSLVDCGDRVEIYDNHIVQERILYEEINEKYSKKNIVSQALLVPIRIKLSKIENNLALEEQSFFKEYGFELDSFSDHEILLRKVPLFNFKDSYENIFVDLLSLLPSKDNKDIREKVIITMSCRESIKAGYRVDDSEMKFLINKLHRLQKYTCPHGRNVIVDITKSYLYNRFQR
jgi:DNA mismatch repair protein MutL